MIEVIEYIDLGPEDYRDIETASKLVDIDLSLEPITCAFKAAYEYHSPARINCRNDDLEPESGREFYDVRYLLGDVDIEPYLKASSKQKFEDYIAEILEKERSEYARY